MAALFTSLGLVPVLRRWALITGKVDIPDTRKVHKQAIPRLGGIAIYLCFLFASLVFIDGTREVRAILAGCLIVFIVGLIDDLYGLSARKKFAGEIAGVLVTMIVGNLYLVNLGNLFGFGSVVLPAWLSGPFTVFAVVGVINAINLIDGLDGLSGGISVIALMAFMLLAFRGDNLEALALSTALLGSILGFLKYNIYPARIFMGDAGSLSVGFILGFLAIHLTQSATGNISPIVPVIILGLPIVDALWVMVSRLVKGGNPFSPDMTHVHHKFLNLGFQHRFTVILIYGISLFWALFAISAHDWPDYMLFYCYLVVTAITYSLLRYLVIHRDRYAFFDRDSAASLRETHTFRTLATAAGYATPALLTLIISYLLLAVLAAFSADFRALIATAIYFPCLLAVWLLKHRLRMSVVKFTLYLGGLVVAFLVDRATDVGLFFGMSLSSVEPWVFLLMIVMIVCKSIFRQRGELFVSVPEIAVLAVGVFALVTFSQTPGLTSFTHIPIRGGLLFLSINIVFFNRNKQPQQAITDPYLFEQGTHEHQNL